MGAAIDRRLVLWRVVLLASASAFWLWQFAVADMAEFGWQFRFLTIWALTLTLAHAALAFGHAAGLTGQRHERLAMVSAAINAVMAMLYWRLRLTDPGALGAPGASPVQDIYLHAVAPALMIVDAVFVMRAFGRPIRAVPGLLLVVAAYVAWIELAVAPLNDMPVGDVTTGLPYPFLNDLAWGERATFYGTALLAGLAFLPAFHILMRLAAGRGPRAGGAAPAE